MRPLNVFTIKHQLPMPNIEHELVELCKSTVYAGFDMSHSYWKLMLALNSQVCQSIITPDGIFTLNRVSHGKTNAVTHGHSSFTEIILDDLTPNIPIWLDEILIHAETVQRLQYFILSFFRLCVDYNFKLHPGKCVLFANEIRWSGRLMSSDGVRYESRRLNFLLSMDAPTASTHLQQIRCALQWVKRGIPNFTYFVAPLHDFLEGVYAIV